MRGTSIDRKPAPQTMSAVLAKSQIHFHGHESANNATRPCLDACFKPVCDGRIFSICPAVHLEPGRNQEMRASLMAILLLALAGCAFPIQTPSETYKAMRPTYGYSEEKSAEDTYKVIFRGYPSTEAAVVRDLALLRAAELAKTSGYAYFSVIDRKEVSESFGGASLNKDLAQDLSGTYGQRTATVMATSGFGPGERQLVVVATVRMFKSERDSKAPAFKVADVIADICARRDIRKIGVNS